MTLGSGEEGGHTHKKPQLLPGWSPELSGLECVCKMMWERPFAKQREGRLAGERDCFCTPVCGYLEAEGLPW